MPLLSIFKQAGTHKAELRSPAVDAFLKTIEVQKILAITGLHHSVRRDKNKNVTWWFL